MRQLFSDKEYKPGQVIVDLFSHVDTINVKNRTRFSVEIAGFHFENPLTNLINHSFEPNAIFTETGLLIAVKEIHKGMPISTNYYHHETEIVHPFIDIETGKTIRI